MTNYFKVYLKNNKGYQKVIAKNKAEVLKILNQANKDGFKKFLIIKRIKPNTDVPIAMEDFNKGCKVTYVDGLDADWRVVGHKVVDWGKYKESEEER